MGSGVINGSPMDFWRVLVDWKSSEETEASHKIGRKMSFVSLGGCDTGEEEIVCQENSL